MIDAQTYAIERAICDKAAAYANKLMGLHVQNGVTKRERNYLTAEETAHPDYAACDNAMRGRVELYELNRDKPVAFTAYVQEPSHEQRDATNLVTCRHSDITTWTGGKLGTVIYSGPTHRNNFGARWRALTVRTIWGETYHGRYYFDAQECVNLRRAKR